MKKVQDIELRIQKVHQILNLLPQMESRTVREDKIIEMCNSELTVLQWVLNEDVGMDNLDGLLKTVQRKKQCLTCRKTKSLTEFYVQSQSADARGANCKQCQKRQSIRRAERAKGQILPKKQ